MSGLSNEVTPEHQTTSVRSDRGFPATVDEVPEDEDDEAEDVEQTTCGPELAAGEQWVDLEDFAAQIQYQ